MRANLQIQQHSNNYFPIVCELEFYITELLFIFIYMVLLHTKADKHTHRLYPLILHYSLPKAMSYDVEP